MGEAVLFMDVRFTLVFVKDGCAVACFFRRISSVCAASVLPDCSF